MGVAITIDFFDSNSNPIEQYSSYAEEAKDFNITFLRDAHSIRIRVIPDNLK